MRKRSTHRFSRPGLPPEHASRRQEPGHPRPERPPVGYLPAESALELLGRVKQQRPGVLPKLLPERRRRAGWPPARSGGPGREGAGQVGRGVSRKLDDHAEQVFQVVGVAAADRQQWPAMAAFVAGVQGQQRRHVRVRPVIRVQELEAVDAERLGQRLQPVAAEPDPERIDVRHHHDGTQGSGGLQRRPQREELRRRRAREGRLQLEEEQVLEGADGELDAPDRLDAACGMRGLPLERPRERLGVVMVRDPDDVDLAVGVGRVQDLLDGRRAVAERRVEVENRLPHDQPRSIGRGRTHGHQPSSGSIIRA